MILQNLSVLIYGCIVIVVRTGISGADIARVEASSCLRGHELSLCRGSRLSVGEGG